MLTTKCLVLICGPPACLKSTLINILRCIFNEPILSYDLKSICLNKLDEILSKRMKCHFLSFDDLFRDYEKEIVENELNWKSYRSLIADELERMICHSSSERISSNLKYSSMILDRLFQSFHQSNRSSLIFIEDNFYYSSMRHRYRQIAQRAHLGFLVIHLHSKLSTALQRNARREIVARVSNQSIENIFSKYEFNDDELRIDTTDRGLTSEHLQMIIQRIERACQHPEEFRNVIDDDEQRQRDRQINEENIMHQIDQRLRKFISNYLKEQFQNEGEKSSTDKEKKKIMAEKINQNRQEYLELIRRKVLQFNQDDQIERHFQEFFQLNVHDH